ncbi:transposase [Neglecta sp. X4]|nr:transposase [Neglectibacter sp. 59]NBJ73153.1 transposase [Neglectibacter sp. X4]NCE80984.1 transposase [Neglectibacter sp. X58]
MLNTILYWLDTGVPWRDLLERFGLCQGVYSRFRTWTKPKYEKISSQP